MVTGSLQMVTCSHQYTVAVVMEDQYVLRLRKPWERNGMNINKFLGLADCSELKYIFRQTSHRDLPRHSCLTAHVGELGSSS